MLVTELCAAMRQTGETAELYCLVGGGPLTPNATDAGVAVHLANAGSVYSPRQVLHLARFLRSHHFDVIHVHLYPAQLWVCLASICSGRSIPIVTTEHSTSNGRRTPWFRIPDRWMYRRFAAIAGISQATLDALLAHIGPDVPLTRVVLNGIDPTRFQPRRPRTAASRTSDLTVLSIGSLTAVKDHATLIRAVALVDGVRLTLAGDGPLRTELEELSVQLGIRSRVEFLGVRRDIPELISTADIYVQASKWEGFCLAAVEAMCGGLPCIASRNSGLQEVVGEAGLYFEPGNVDELAATIRSLCANPPQRAAMADLSVGQAGKFTLQACCDAYRALYCDAIQAFANHMT